jgi:hypothetical protein
MIDEEGENDGFEMPSMKIDRLVTDEHLQTALDDLAMLSSKSVMAARALVQLKCGPKVSAADAAADGNRDTSLLVITGPLPKTQEELDRMRRYLSPDFVLDEDATAQAEPPAISHEDFMKALGISDG